MQKLFMVIHGQQLKNNIEVRKGCYTKLLKYKDVPKVYLQRKLDKCIEFFKTKDIKISY